MVDFKCEVCESDVMEEDCGTCFTCGWVGDTLQEMEPDYRDGANKISLTEARAAWEAKKRGAQPAIPQRAVV